MHALSLLADVLKRLAIPYAVGGSLASSARGIVRATFDADIVARVTIFQVNGLAKELGPDWYADRQQMCDAITSRRSFNLIHIPSGYKIDIFPASEEFHDRQLERATLVDIEFAGETTPCPVATAEDILLAKLQWYQAGGSVSERQWNDIAGVLAVNRDLDFGYINMWAARLGVAKLLAKALEDTRGSRS